MYVENRRKPNFFVMENHRLETIAGDSKASFPDRVQALAELYVLWNQDMYKQLCIIKRIKQLSHRYRKRYRRITMSRLSAAPTDDD